MAGVTSAEMLPKISAHSSASQSDCRSRVLTGGKWECMRHESRPFKYSSCGRSPPSAAGTGLPNAERSLSAAALEPKPSWFLGPVQACYLSMDLHHSVY